MKNVESYKRHIYRLTFLGLSLVTGFLFVSLLSKHLYHLASWIGYVIGLTGLWIGLPVALFLFLSCFVLGRKPKWLKIRLIAGLLVILLGTSVIWGFKGLNGEANFDYSVYNEAFKTAFDAHNSILFVNELGGGLLGTLLASCFKATKVDALVYVFGSLLILVGLILTILPWLIVLSKKGKAKKNSKKAKEAEKNQEKEIEEKTPAYLDSIGINEEAPSLERPTLNFDAPKHSLRTEEKIEFEQPIERKEDARYLYEDINAPKEAVFVLKGENEVPFVQNTEISEEPIHIQPEITIPEPKEEPKNEPVSILEAEPEKEEKKEVVNQEVEQKPEVATVSPMETIIEAKEPEPAKVAVPSTPFPLARPRPDYVLPGTDLLKEYDNSEAKEEQLAECESRKETITKVFEGLHIGARVISYEVGPSVTRYNIDTDSDVLPAVLNRAVTKIQSALGGVLASFQESVLGSMYSALEIPNEKRMTVSMKEVFTSLPPLSEKTRTYIPFGESISGSFYSADLTEFPHMLVAGTTGSGKSVYNNSVIMSLLMRNRPEDLKLIMVDPKQVEFMMYEDIPHLLCPIITDPKEAKVAIEKLVDEMERRNGIIRKAGVKKLSEYNRFAKENGYETLPYIIFVVDEFADLMLTCKGLDELIARLAAKSRSAGIHLIICTQRPSVDVISGTIKANIIVRVALSVSSPTDSMTVLGEGGAENLAGYGDMLVSCGQVVRNSNFRAQGCYVDNSEIKNVVDFIKAQQKVQYDPRFMDLSGKSSNSSQSHSTTQYGMRAGTARDDEAYEDVKNKVMHCEYYSMTRMNREFGFGYTRSGKIFQWLKDDGIIEDSENKSNAKGCKVLVRLNDDVDNSGSTDNSEFVPSSDPDDY